MTHGGCRGTSDYVQYRVGADENGLGPRLGPMIVTAVLARVDESGWAVAGSKPKGALAKRLGDSKAFMSHGDVALGEAWARALCARLTPGVAIARPDQIVDWVSLTSRAELRRPCPKHVEGQCWTTGAESFEADDKLVRSITGDLDRLATKGVHIEGVRAAIVCTRKLNDDVDRGLSRFSTDLHSMERLVLSFVEQTGAEVHAVCGKVGGFGKYEPAFGPLSGRMLTTLEETRKCSTYRFPGVGVMSFVMDADASDMLVSMASMVGKYLRELLMARITRYYQAEVADLPDASGYHDPVTKIFVEGSALVRKRQRIPDDCFERRKLGPAPKPRAMVASGKRTAASAR